METVYPKEVLKQEIKYNVNFGEKSLRVDFCQESNN